MALVMPIALTAAKIVNDWAAAILFGGAGLLLVLRRANTAAIVLLRGAALIASASGLAWFACVFASVTEEVGGLSSVDAWDAFLSAPFAAPWLVRIALCGLCLAAVASRSTSISISIFMALGALLAVNQAWLGHAADAHGAALATNLGVAAAHSLAGFAWVGALTMLSLLARVEGRVPRDGLAAFSNVGIALVALIAASGSINALDRGVDPIHLGATLYGRMLTGKLVLVAAMLALALANRLRRDDGASASMLGYSVAAEAVLGLIVIALAANLGLTPPPG